MTLDETKEAAILESLTRHNGNVTRVATELDIDPKTARRHRKLMIQLGKFVPSNSPSGLSTIVPIAPADGASDAKRT